MPLVNENVLAQRATGMLSYTFYNFPLCQLFVMVPTWFYEYKTQQFVVVDSTGSNKSSLSVSDITF